MRTTTLLKALLGMQHLRVTGFAVEAGALVIEVCPAWRTPRCSGCQRRRSHYDTRPPRRWRHLDFGGVRVYLRYGLRRVACRTCGVVVEAVPWCAVTTARFTTRFEEAVGFLVQRCDKTSVQELFGIAWVTVGQIVERVVHRHRPDDPLEGLLAIGVDELSYRKGHKYVTTVTDLLSGRIVWAAEGKSAATLLRFFEDLGDARCAALAVVTMDMSEAYITAVQQQLPTAQIVFDRFHVQQLVSKALDDTRRAEWRRLINDNYFGRSTTMRLAGWWAARCACETACFPLGGRVGNRRAGAAIAREADGREDGGGGRGGRGDGRADGAPLAARGLAIGGEGAADVADAGGSVCGRVAVGGGASVGGRRGGAAAGADAVRVAL